MPSNYKLNYNVDMVFCIDVTGSMDNIINIVRDNAINLYPDLKNHMAGKRKQIHGVRVRIIAFRDYLADGENAMLVTRFFHLPEEAEDLERCVSGLVAQGGGDDPEDGLEALAYAMKSDWDNTPGTKKRHVVMLWTDDDCHPLGFGARSPYYPRGMARDIRELTAWWGDDHNPGVMNQEAKRLVLFAPYMGGWTQIVDNWDKTIQVQSAVGKGLQELQYEQILATISNTI